MLSKKQIKLRLKHYEHALIDLSVAFMRNDVSNDKFVVLSSMYAGYIKALKTVLGDRK